MADKTPPLACDLDALTEAERVRQREGALQLKMSVREVESTPDGYAFRLDDGAEVLMQAAEFIALERRCCPFVTFRLDVGAAGGPIWLRLSGGEGVKAFLTEEFHVEALARDASAGTRRAES